MNTPLNSIPSRGAVLTASGSPRTGRLVRRSFTAMTPVERTRVLAMYGVIAGLHLVSRFNLNTAGFVIVGMFLLTWLAALLIWRYGHIEEKRSARLQHTAADGTVRERAQR